jgi:hypothetical protein
MLDATTIRQRLKRMRQEPGPRIMWDQTCEGSGCALVIFVGPSPGGKKRADRQPLKTRCKTPLWNQPYDAPLTWSRGFRASFKPMVEALFQAPYESAARLIGRANMDWVGNPESKDVAVRFMWEGRQSVLQMIKDTRPELVVAMDAKTCEVLEIALYDAGFAISSVHPRRFTVRISNGHTSSPRVHRGLQAFRVESREGGDFVVVKAPQHPARMFNVDYARRCGEAIRKAATQIAAHRPVNVRA